jgi:hypothetical protein
MNGTLSTMNTTLTSIDQRLQGIQTDVAKMAREGIKPPPPNPTEKRDRIPTPPPNPAGSKPESPSLTPQQGDAQPSPAPSATAEAQLDQATERNRTAAAELQALLGQIKAKPSGDQPPSGRAKPGAAKGAAPAEKTVAPI